MTRCIMIKYIMIMELYMLFYFRQYRKEALSENRALAAPKWEGLFFEDLECECRIMAAEAE